MKQIFRTFAPDGEELRRFAETPHPRLATHCLVFSEMHGYAWVLEMAGVEDVKIETTDTDVAEMLWTVDDALTVVVVGNGYGPGTDEATRVRFMYGFSYTYDVL